MHCKRPRDSRLEAGHLVASEWRKRITHWRARNSSDKRNLERRGYVARNSRDRCGSRPIRNGSGYIERRRDSPRERRENRKYERPLQIDADVESRRLD